MSYAFSSSFGRHAIHHVGTQHHLGAGGDGFALVAQLVWEQECHSSTGLYRDGAEASLATGVIVIEVEDDRDEASLLRTRAIREIDVQWKSSAGLVPVVSQPRIESHGDVRCER